MRGGGASDGSSRPGWNASLLSVRCSVVLAQAAIPPQPAESALYHPPPLEHLEAARHRWGSCPGSTQNPLGRTISEPNRICSGIGVKARLVARYSTLSRGMDGASEASMSRRSSRSQAYPLRTSVVPPLGCSINKPWGWHLACYTGEKGGAEGQNRTGDTTIFSWSMTIRSYRILSCFGGPHKQNCHTTVLCGRLISARIRLCP